MIHKTHHSQKIKVFKNAPGLGRQHKKLSQNRFSLCPTLTMGTLNNFRQLLQRFPVYPVGPRYLKNYEFQSIAIGCLAIES